MYLSKLTKPSSLSLSAANVLATTTVLSFSLLIFFITIGEYLFALKFERETIIRSAQTILHSHEKLRANEDYHKLALKLWSQDNISGVAFYNESCNKIAAIPISYNPLSECINYQKTDIELNFEDLISNIDKVYLRKDASLPYYFLSNRLQPAIALIVLVYFFSFFWGLRAIRKRIHDPIEKIKSLLVSFEKWHSYPNSTHIYSEFKPLIDELWDAKQRLSLAEKRKLEHEKNRSLIEMATKIAHDIRSPISSLQVISENKQYNEKVDTLLKRAIERINLIASDLLTEFKSEKNNPYSLSDFLNDIRFLIEEKNMVYHSENLQILLDCKENNISLPDNYRGLIPNISNMINNSIEASSRKSEIYIRILVEIDDSTFFITIEDKGPGIPLEIQSRIGDAPLKSKKPYGNGLGLFNVYKYVENMGGNIQITSRPEEGTKVQIAIKM